MSVAPEVSVVMSVYNGAATLQETLLSVLDQEGCEFEFIVVNDGSSDDSARILDECAERYPRLRVLHQGNTGLTRALILGCGLARGEFIARQDAGDISLPGRFLAQLNFIRQHPRAVLVASAAQILGPLRESLFTTSLPMFELDSALRQQDAASVRGPPHHGATLFRRDAYERAGGYRVQFAVAQDIDLWLRLAALGQCLGLDQIHYQARLDVGSISSRRRDDQLRMTKLALESSRIRLDGGDDHALVEGIVAPLPSPRALSGVERARFYYFVASCLRAHSPKAAKGYFQRAVQDNPLHLKALMRWIAG